MQQNLVRMEIQYFNKFANSSVVHVTLQNYNDNSFTPFDCILNGVL